MTMREASEFDYIIGGAVGSVPPSGLARERSGRAEPGRQRQGQEQANDRDEPGNHVNDVHRASDRLGQPGELAGAEHLARRRLHQAVYRIAGFRQLAMDGEINDRTEYRRTDR